MIECNFTACVIMAEKMGISRQELAHRIAVERSTTRQMLPQEQGHNPN
jgi:ribosome-binding protein aMBF1 (putative translation factor)